MLLKFASVLLVILSSFGQEPASNATQRDREAAEPNQPDAPAHFRQGERDFQQHAFQPAANEFREALSAHPHPKWIDTWAHIYLGEIFDLTGQRDRAVREYHRAAQMGDDTEGVRALIHQRLYQAATTENLKTDDILVPYLSTPRVRKRAAPVYSPEARLAELEGTVTLAATVAANGSVTDLRVVKPLGLGLDETAKAAAAYWSFEPGTTKDGPAPMLTMMDLHFLIPSKRSRWHLLRADFSAPEGVSRPRFVSVSYPVRNGIGEDATDVARIAAIFGRQAFVTLSFEIDQTGRPVHFLIQRATEPIWGKEAVMFLSRWRFSPGRRNGNPVSVPCTIDLVWGGRILSESALEWAQEALQQDELPR